MDPVDSEWDDIFVPTTLDYEGNSLEVKKIVTHLRQAFPDDELKVDLEFETYDMLKRFEKKLQQEWEIYNPEHKVVEKNDWDNIWRDVNLNFLKKNSSELDKLKVYKVIFKNPLQLIVFYIHYAKKIQRLETEYSYVIAPYSKKLVVYLKDPYEQKINSFFVNELYEMKNKMVIYVDSDQQIYNKARYSKIAVQKLEKANIKTMIINRFSIAVFFSESFTCRQQLKKEVRRILAYHISVIKFPEQFVDSYILQEIIKLIYFQIKPALKEIQSYYDMPVEVDIEKAAIVITDLHQVFTDGVQLVKDTLKKLKIIQIECDYLVDLKKIMQKTQYLPLVKFNYRYRKCFLLFSDPLTQKHAKIIQKLCDQISTVFRGKYRLVLHFAHLFQDLENLRSETQRTIMIAAECQLNCMTFNTFHLFRNCDKVVFEPVELNVYAEDFRVRQIKTFLHGFLTNETPVKRQFKYDIFDSIALEESVIGQAIQESKTIFQSRKDMSSTNNKAFDIENKQNQKNLSEDQAFNKPISTSTTDSSFNRNSQFLQLSIPFEYPSTKDFEEDEPMKRGKRQRELENLMETEFKRKLMIWKVIMNSSVQMPSMNSHDRIQLIVPALFQRKNNLYKLKKYADISSKKLKDFESGQKGYISFVNSKRNAFVPLYQVHFTA